MNKMQASPDRFQPIDIIFDSSKADNGDLDNPMFKLSPELDNIVGASVQWVSCPFTYYVIDRTNNAFEVIVQISYTDGQDDLQTRTSQHLYYQHGSGNAYPPTGVNPDYQTIGDQKHFKFHDGTSALEPNTRFSSVYRKVFLRPGTYTPDALTTEIRQAMINYLPLKYWFRCQDVNIHRYWNVQLDPSNSRLLIYNNFLPGWAREGGNLNKTNLPENGGYARLNKARGVFALRFGSSLGEILGFEPNKWLISDDQRHVYSGTTMIFNQNQQQNPDLDAVSFPGLEGTRSANLLQNQRLNVHSSLAFLFNNNRMQSDTGDLIKTIPIDTNYSSYIVHAASSEPYQISRSNINQVSFYLTVGDRRFYSSSGHELRNTELDNVAFVQIPDEDDPTVTVGLDVSEYSTNQTFRTQSYLHLNGEPFMVCIRFYRDDGFMAQ